MSVPDNRQHATDVNTTCIEPRSFLTKCTISAFPFRGKHDTQHFLWQLHLNLIMHHILVLTLPEKYLLEGYKVKANMEIILVVYVNEQLKINKTLQLIWDRNFSFILDKSWILYMIFQFSLLNNWIVRLLKKNFFMYSTFSVLKIH